MRRPDGGHVGSRTTAGPELRSRAVISRGGDATRRQLGLAQQYENLTAGRLGDDDGRRPARRLPHGVGLIVAMVRVEGDPERRAAGRPLGSAPERTVGDVAQRAMGLPEHSSDA